MMGNKVRPSQLVSNFSPEKKRTIRRVYENTAGNTGEFRLDMNAGTNEVLDQFRAQLREQF